MPKKYTADDFINLASKKFNNKFSYKINDPYNNNELQVITCPDHGDILISGHQHLNSKCGCVLCGDNQRSKKISFRNPQSLVPWSERLMLLNEMYSGKYIFPEKFEGNYTDKIDVICPKHGKFTKHLFVLLNNNREHQCQKCRYESTKTFKKMLIDKDEAAKKAYLNRSNANRSRKIEFAEAIKRFKKVHGDKFTYIESEYTGISNDISFFCAKHGKVSMNGKEHELSAHGCPKCAVTNKSKIECQWIENCGIKETQYTIVLRSGKKVIVDGYDHSSNTVYEFLGDFWHGHPSWHDKFNGVNVKNRKSFVSLYEDTKDRFDQISQLGYNIIYIWESDFNKSPDIKREYKGTLEC